VSVEGGNGDGRIHPSGNVDIAHPLSQGKRVTPTKPKKKNKHSSPTKVGASASQDAHPRVGGFRVWGLVLEPE
jgi:hypothetical protein